MRAKLLYSCLTLCDSMDCNPPDSSVHGILQAGILAWVAMPSFRGSSPPRDQIWISYDSPALAGESFTTSTIWGATSNNLIGRYYFYLHFYFIEDRTKAQRLTC